MPSDPAPVEAPARETDRPVETTGSESVPAPVAPSDSTASAGFVPLPDFQGKLSRALRTEPGFGHWCKNLPVVSWITGDSAHTRLMKSLSDHVAAEVAGYRERSDLDTVMGLITEVVQRGSLRTDSLKWLAHGIYRGLDSADETREVGAALIKAVLDTQEPTAGRYNTSYANQIRQAFQLDATQAQEIFDSVAGTKVATALQEVKALLARYSPTVPGEVPPVEETIGSIKAIVNQYGLSLADTHDQLETTMRDALAEMFDSGRPIDLSTQSGLPGRYEDIIELGHRLLGDSEHIYHFAAQRLAPNTIGDQDRRGELVDLLRRSNGTGARDIVANLLMPRPGSELTAELGVTPAAQLVQEFRAQSDRDGVPDATLLERAVEQIDVAREIHARLLGQQGPIDNLIAEPFSQLRRDVLECAYDAIESIVRAPGDDIDQAVGRINRLSQALSLDSNRVKLVALQAAKASVEAAPEYAHTAVEFLSRIGSTPGPRAIRRASNELRKVIQARGPVLIRAALREPLEAGAPADQLEAARGRVARALELREITLSDRKHCAQVIHDTVSDMVKVRLHGGGTEGDLLIARALLEKYQEANSDLRRWGRPAQELRSRYLQGVGVQVQQSVRRAFDEVEIRGTEDLGTAVTRFGAMTTELNEMIATYGVSKAFIQARLIPMVNRGLQGLNAQSRDLDERLILARQALEWMEPGSREVTRLARNVDRLSAARVQHLVRDTRPSAGSELDSVEYVDTLCQSIGQSRESLIRAAIHNTRWWSRDYRNWSAQRAGHILTYFRDRREGDVTGSPRLMRAWQDLRSKFPRARTTAA